MRLELPVLLAARLREIGWIVFRPDDDLAARAAQEIRDVQGERRVPALMATGHRAVEPDGRGVIDRAEVQEQAIAGREWRHLDHAPVPARVVEPGVSDTTLDRLRRKRHHDPAIPGDIAGPLVSSVTVQRKLPDAVQGQPGRAPQLRPRIGMAQSDVEIGGRQLNYSVEIGHDGVNATASPGVRGTVEASGAAAEWWQRHRRQAWVTEWKEHGGRCTRSDILKTEDRSQRRKRRHRALDARCSSVSSVGSVSPFFKSATSDISPACSFPRQPDLTHT